MLEFACNTFKLIVIAKPINVLYILVINKLKVINGDDFKLFKN